MTEAGLLKNYSNMTDESIIEQIKLGDNNALNYIMDNSNYTPVHISSFM